MNTVYTSLTVISLLIQNLKTNRRLHYVDNTCCYWNAFRFWSNNVRNEQV